MAKRRPLELYEVLQRQTGQKPARSRIRDFIPWSDSSDAESAVEDPVILPAQPQTDEPATDDVILPPSSEAAAQPDVSATGPTSEDDLERQVFSRAATFSSSERGVIVTARYNTLVVAGAAVTILLMGVFMLGRLTAPASATPEAPATENADPLAQARGNPEDFNQIGVVPGAGERQQPPALHSTPPPAIQGPYWEVLIESYPAPSKATMAQRAKTVLENARLRGVVTRTRSDGKMIGLWSPPFRSEAEARSFRQRLKQVGAQLNRQYNLGSDFADPVIRKRNGS